MSDVVYDFLKDRSGEAVGLSEIANELFAGDVELAKDACFSMSVAHSDVVKVGDRPWNICYMVKCGVVEKKMESIETVKVDGVKDEKGALNGSEGSEARERRRVVDAEYKKFKGRLGRSGIFLSGKRQPKTERIKWMKKNYPDFCDDVKYKKIVSDRLSKNYAERKLDKFKKPKPVAESKKKIGDSDSSREMSEEAEALTVNREDLIIGERDTEIADLRSKALVACDKLIEVAKTRNKLTAELRDANKLLDLRNGVISSQQKELNVGEAELKVAVDTISDLEKTHEVEMARLMDELERGGIEVYDKVKAYEAEIKQLRTKLNNSSKIIKEKDEYIKMLAGEDVDLDNLLCPTCSSLRAELEKKTNVIDSLKFSADISNHVIRNLTEFKNTYSVESLRKDKQINDLQVALSVYAVERLDGIKQIKKAREQLDEDKSVICVLCSDVKSLKLALVEQTKVFESEIEEACALKCPICCNRLSGFTKVLCGEKFKEYYCSMCKRNYMLAAESYINKLESERKPKTSKNE